MLHNEFELIPVFASFCQFVHFMYQAADLACSGEHGILKGSVWKCMNLPYVVGLRSCGVIALFLLGLDCGVARLLRSYWFLLVLLK